MQAIEVNIVGYAHSLPPCNLMIAINYYLNERIFHKYKIMVKKTASITTQLITISSHYPFVRGIHLDLPLCFYVY